MAAYSVVEDGHAEYQAKYVQGPMAEFMELCLENTKGLAKVSENYKSVASEAEASFRSLKFRLYALVVANILAAYFLSLGIVKFVRYKI